MNVCAVRVGSIPANAGETRTFDAPCPPTRVYPRERGGDAQRRRRVFVVAGLSPRTRGRPGQDRRERGRFGSIPANAGETRYGRVAVNLPRVYPRERGGDIAVSPLAPTVQGLSPRTRGRLARATEGDVAERSIPANAGETGRASRRATATRVYPRERGGDALMVGIASRLAGLSPRTRGRPRRTARRCPTAGSIPANAGETPPR